MKKSLLIKSLLGISLLLSNSLAQGETVNLMPQPVALEVKAGAAFHLVDSTVLVNAAALPDAQVALYAEMLSKVSGEQIGAYRSSVGCVGNPQTITFLCEFIKMIWV